MIRNLILPVFYILCFSLSLNAQVSKTVNITAGGLSATLTAQEKNTITALTITGTIDARDFKTMRNDMPVLADLDLSEVTILAYNGLEGTTWPVGCTNFNGSTNYPANCIPDQAFYFCTMGSSFGKATLRSVILPENLTAIGVSAFSHTSLSSIVIPKGVNTIRSYAFNGCALETIYLNSCIPLNPLSTYSENPFPSVSSNCKFYVPFGHKTYYKSIHSGIFQTIYLDIIEMPGFSIPTECEIENGVNRDTTFMISSDVKWSASSDKDWLKIYPSTGNGSQTITIRAEGNLLSGSRIAHIKFFSEGLCEKTLTVRDNAPIIVTAGNLKTTIPIDELTEITKLTLIGSIDARDFRRMSYDLLPGLTEIDLSRANILGYTGTEGPVGTSSVEYSANTVPDNSFRIPPAFQGKRNLTKVLLPLSTKSIGKEAFNGCLGLISCIIPDSTVIIGNGAFLDCAELKEVNFPPSVTTIGNGAFHYCYNLTSVTIPSSVKMIGPNAFMSCSKLISVKVNWLIPLDLRSSFGVFIGVNKANCKLYVPYGTSALYKAADQWKDFVNIVESPGVQISVNTLDVPAAQNTTSFEIQSNVAWTVSSNQPWISISPTSGAGNKTISVTTEANTLNPKRSGIITINGVDFDTKTIVVNQKSNAVNQIPVANAGADQNINEGAMATIDGSISSDPDGDPLTYKWTAPQGITLSSTSAQKPTFTAPLVTANINYTFSLVVNDGMVDSPPDQVIVAVKNVNQPPVANAGADQNVNAGTMVFLDGSLSIDPDSDLLTYKWTASDGITLSSPSVPKPTFIAPQVNTNTSYTFTLVVNDGLVDSQVDNLVITVLNKPNHAPTKPVPISPVATDKIDATTSTKIKWNPSIDEDLDIITYSIRIFNDVFDKTFPNVNSGHIISAHALGGHTTYKYTITASDGIASVTSVEEFINTINHKSTPFQYTSPKMNEVVKFVDGKLLIETTVPVDVDKDKLIKNIRLKGPGLDTLISIDPLITQTYIDSVKLYSNSEYALSGDVTDGLSITYSQPIKFKTPIYVGIEDLINNFYIKEYPNPTSGKVSIVLNDDRLVGTYLTVYNAIGSVILKRLIQQPEEMIDLSGNAPGVYLIRSDLKEIEPARIILK